MNPSGKKPRRKLSASAKNSIKLFKAVSHELRQEILVLLSQEETRRLSPNEISKLTGEGLSKVSYHVKILKDFKCIRPRGTEPRRGAVEHFYVLNEKGEEALELLS